MSNLNLGQMIFFLKEKIIFSNNNLHSTSATCFIFINSVMISNANVVQIASDSNICTIDKNYYFSVYGDGDVSSTGSRNKQNAI